MKNIEIFQLLILSLITKKHHFQQTKSQSVSKKEIIPKCIPGKNCPYKRGTCINNQCFCYKYYWTYQKESANPNPKKSQVFCNYTRLSRFVPLILEIFIPCFGHLLAGKLYLFLIKFCLIVIPIACICCGMGTATFVTSLRTGLQTRYNEVDYPFLIKCYGIISIVDIVIFGVVYVVDIICYTFAFYTDGNGVPLV